MTFFLFSVIILDMIRKNGLIVSVLLIVLATVFSLTVRETIAVSEFNFSFAVTPKKGFVSQKGLARAVIDITSPSEKKRRVVLSTAFQPAGLKIKFRPSGCIPPCSSIMTVYAKEIEKGVYRIPIIVSGRGITKTSTYRLVVTPHPYLLKSPRLIFPSNNSIVSNLNPLLDWSSVAGAKVYFWEIGDKMGKTSKSSLIIPKGTVSYNKEYSWRVMACADLSFGNCSDWSEQRKFRTPAGKEVKLLDLKLQIASIKEALIQIQKALKKLLVK